MGPGDPFASVRRSPLQGTAPQAAAVSAPGPAPGPASASRPDPEPADRSATVTPYVIGGGLVGLAFGVAILIKGLLAALVLGLFAGLGGITGLGVWAVTSGRVDVRGGLDTLLRRSPRRRP